MSTLPSRISSVADRSITTQLPLRHGGVVVESRIQARRLYLPQPPRLPADVPAPFSWARRFGDRVYVSGHSPQAPDGNPIGPYGRVGIEVSPDQARQAARLALLGVIGSLKREIGDLGRVAAWLRIEGFVLTTAGFDRATTVVAAASELLVDLFGPEIGRHARTAIGVAATPLNSPVVIAAEVALRA